MPLPTNYSRPRLPYNPVQSLPNSQRFTLLGQRPPTAQMFDAEINALIDYVNMLAAAINNVQAGAIPGSDDPANANKLLETNGAGVISWKKITDVNINDQAITTRTLDELCVIEDKIGNGAVTYNKISPGAVGIGCIANNVIFTNQVAKYGLNIDRLSPIPSGQLLVGDNGTGNIIGLGANAANLALMSTGNNTKPQFRQFTGNDIQNASIPAGKYVAGSIASGDLANNSVITSKIADKNVTVDKVGSGNAINGSVLIANGAGGASFLANSGRVLQVVKYQYNDVTSTDNSNTFVSFGVPFKVTITPQKTNSTILVYLSVNLAGQSKLDDCVYGMLYKNDVPWQESVKISSAHLKATFSFMQSSSEAGYTLRNYSGMFIDNNDHTNAITYELKACNVYLSTGPAKSVLMNTTPGENNVGVSSMIAIEIDL